MSTSAVPLHESKQFRNVATRVILICWFTMIFEGYDLVVYGTVAPSLLHYTPWKLNPALIGVMSSSVVIGMAIGALLVGFLTDQVGRKKTLVASLLVFSIANGLCGFAPSPIIFVLFRFISGLGLGGFLPTSTAMTVEYTNPRRRMLTYMLMFSGYGIGGILASILAIPLIPAFGWQIMFWLNALACITAVPITILLLPESLGFLIAKNRIAEAERIAERLQLRRELENIRRLQNEATSAPQQKGWEALRTLFSPAYIVATIIFAVATFLTLFMVFGVNTWLTQFMILSGYSLRSSLIFVAVLQTGNIIGNIIAGALADRLGAKIVGIVMYILGAIGFILLSFKVPLSVAYLLVILVGNGTLGAQNLLNVYIADHYPTNSRASAVGWAVGAGRLGGLLGPNVIGLFLAAHVPLAWNFLLLGIPGLINAVALLFISRRPQAVDEELQVIEAGELGA